MAKKSICAMCGVKERNQPGHEPGQEHPQSDLPYAWFHLAMKRWSQKGFVDDGVVTICFMCGLNIKGRIKVE